MPRTHQSLFIAALLFVAPTVASAAASQGKPNEVVVTGTRLDPAQARKQAIEFVRRSGVARGQQQIARWVNPVCPKVTGIRDDQAIEVEQRMRAIATAAGIPVARRGCDSNIIVAFTKDASALVRAISSRKSSQFNEVPVNRREILRNGAAPVRWWYATQMRDREGMPQNSIAAPWISTDEGALPVSLPIADGVTATQQYNGGSLVRTPTIRALYGATVVVDISRTGDADLGAISHYAAMVAFAELSAEAASPGSILALFEPKSVERTITDWDLAFLQSLYRMPLDRKGRLQRGHLVEALLAHRVRRTAPQAQYRR